MERNIINNQELILRLGKPNSAVDVVFDTDAYNEIDDQFALAYLIRSNEKLNLKAIYAAPFYNDKVSSVKEGMELSYREIYKVLDLMDEYNLKECVYRGSDEFMKDESTLVVSEAAKDLVDRSKKHTKSNPLYVIAVGAITNVASAIRMDPTICERIVVVWLGGHAHHWPHNSEYNLRQDIPGARILFDCGVPLIQLPALGVTSAFTVSGPELDYWLKGKNKICDYLVDITKNEAKKYYDWKTWTRPIWDVTAIAWLLDEELMLDYVVNSPIVGYDHRYSFDPTRHFIKYVYHINRDKLLEDLVNKLTK